MAKANSKLRLQPRRCWRGTLKFVGQYNEDQLLLITNTTAKEVLASFADSQKPFAVSFIQVDPYTNDPDFPTAYDSADVIENYIFV